MASQRGAKKKLIHVGAVSRLITSHIGLNPETQKGMLDRRIEVELVPQGTLVERIRAAGFGLGGVLTKTGLDTIAAEGQRTCANVPKTRALHRGRAALSPGDRDPRA